MLEMRGAENSMITGSSVHNQRIERLWRDMHGSVTVPQDFYFLEHHSHSILSMTSGPYIFIPRINRSLKEFVNSWNNHPIRTAQPNHHSNCLLQVVYCCKTLRFRASSILLMIPMVDPDGPIPISQESISVPQSTRFSDADMQLETPY